MNRPIDSDFGDIETLLRRRLSELADHAPVTVRQPDELTVSWTTADTTPNRRRRAAGIGATIAVIAGGVGISTVAFQGASNPGGADSPEEAVQEFADALEREDVLGMIDVALPEEVSALRAVVEDATQRGRAGRDPRRVVLARRGRGDRRRGPRSDADDREPRHRPRDRHRHWRNLRRDVRSGVVPARFDRPRGVGRRPRGQPVVAAVGRYRPERDAGDGRPRWSLVREPRLHGCRVRPRRRRCRRSHHPSRSSGSAANRRRPRRSRSTNNWRRSISKARSR